MKKSVILLGIALAAAIGCAGEPGDVIKQRQAFRREVEAQPEKLERYLKSPDAVIRRYALYLTVKQKGMAAKEICKVCMKDPDEQVRLTALGALLHYCRKDSDVQKILAETAASDKSREVAKMAADAAWPFHREVVLIRNNPFWDHVVTTLRKERIPENNWKFKLDPRGIGHLPYAKWYREGLKEDKTWASIRQGEWEKQGYDYNGVAWYRIRFTMPEKMDCNAVELAFSGVDESAWVWLNGVYLGCHDLGPSGWNVPFSLDCTKEVRWGRENILAVRILDTAGDGGIYKPVEVEILK